MITSSQTIPTVHVPVAHRLGQVDRRQDENEKKLKHHHFSNIKKNKVRTTLSQQRYVFTISLSLSLSLYFESLNLNVLRLESVSRSSSQYLCKHTNEYEI